MLERINKDIIAARKADQKFFTLVLSALKAELIYNEKRKKPQSQEDVILAYSRKLNKGLGEYKKGGAAEEILVGLQLELDIVSKYGPVLQSEDFIEELVENYFASVEITIDEKPGQHIGFLKKEFGEQNGGNIAKYAMAYIEKYKEAQK